MISLPPRRKALHKQTKGCPSLPKEHPLSAGRVRKKAPLGELAPGSAGPVDRGSSLDDYSVQVLSDEGEVGRSGQKGRRKAGT